MHYEQCSLRKIKGACLRPQRTILGNVCWQKGRLRLFGIKTKALMTDLDLLRAELDDFAQPVKKKSLTPREERIIAGFEDIQQFVEDHGRVRSEEHTSELQSRGHLVCRLLLENKKNSFGHA